MFQNVINQNFAGSQIRQQQTPGVPQQQLFKKEVEQNGRSWTSSLFTFRNVAAIGTLAALALGAGLYLANQNQPVIDPIIDPANDKPAVENLPEQSPVNSDPLNGQPLEVDLVTNSSLNGTELGQNLTEINLPSANISSNFSGDVNGSSDLLKPLITEDKVDQLAKGMIIDNSTVGTNSSSDLLKPLISEDKVDQLAKGIIIENSTVDTNSSADLLKPLITEEKVDQLTKENIIDNSIVDTDSSNNENLNVQEESIQAIPSKEEPTVYIAVSKEEGNVEAAELDSAEKSLESTTDVTQQAISEETAENVISILVPAETETVIDDQQVEASTADLNASSANEEVVLEQKQEDANEEVHLEQKQEELEVEKNLLAVFESPSKTEGNISSNISSNISNN